MAKKKTKYSPIIDYNVKEVPINSIEVWEEAEARSLDADGVRELADSIKKEGLQNPPLVQRVGTSKYRLISGQRRLAALRRLGANSIPVLVLKQQRELEDAKAASLIENLHRKPMNSKDMAEACNFLAEKMGSTRKAASALGVSKRTFASYQGFRGVPEQLKQLVPKRLSRDEATRLWNIVPEVGKALETANRISKYSSATRKRYLKALEEEPNAPHETIKRRADKLKAMERITMNLSSGQAKGLAQASGDMGLEPQELAKKVVSDWLARRGFS